MEKECRFCKIGRGERGEYGVVDSPFFSGENYFSIVSIGAFIDGWTMIVTREHMYNMHREYEKSDFKGYLRTHIDIVRKKYEKTDKILIFEHGANKCDSLTACGTSHAHLHVIPFEGSILKEIQEDREWVKCRLEQVEEIVGEKEYLLYGESDGSQSDIDVYIHMVEIPESQYFRKILGEKIGLSGAFSYKEDIRAEESEKIRKKLEGK